MQVAERLLEGPGRDWASRVFFTDNGSTATEVAIKMGFRCGLPRGIYMSPSGWPFLSASSARALPCSTRATFVMYPRKVLQVLFLASLPLKFFEVVEERFSYGVVCRHYCTRDVPSTHAIFAVADVPCWCHMALPVCPHD